MKTTALSVLISFLLVAGLSAWGQADQLGVHSFNKGCVACHTPHSTGRTDTTTTRYFAPNQAGSPFAPIAQGFTWSASSTGQPVNGNVYLWNRALPQTTFKTWDGGQITGTDVTGPQNAEVHTLLCLTCHDNSMNSTYMSLGNWLAGAHVGFTPGTVSGGKISYGIGNLSNSHPVHIRYADTDGSGNVVAPEEFWQVSINSNGTVTFRDADTNQLGDGAHTGHPAKLYAEGGAAYVECASCHDPHRQTKYAYRKANGAYAVGDDNSTVHYIRGPYSDPYALAGNTTDNGVMNAGFCRSCHYGKSMEYVNNAGAPR